MKGMTREQYENLGQGDVVYDREQGGNDCWIVQFRNFVDGRWVICMSRVRVEGFTPERWDLAAKCERSIAMEPDPAPDTDELTHSVALDRLEHGAQRRGQLIEFAACAQE